MACLGILLPQILKILGCLKLLIVEVEVVVRCLLLEAGAIPLLQRRKRSHREPRTNDPAW